jgi:ribonuclease HI
LRNAGATYQRCMNHMFGEHIGRTVEAYVDDIVVKTRKASDLLTDLETTFKCLKAKGVKLNPEKCVFGVPRGMLLGFIVFERGIEANPEKSAPILVPPTAGEALLIYVAATTQVVSTAIVVERQEEGHALLI